MGILQDLDASRDETLRYFALGAADQLRRYGPNKWCVSYVLHHLADVEATELERIHRTLSETRPTLLTIDADAWASGLAYESRSLSLSRALFESARNTVIHYARLFYESKGAREYVHSEFGPVTLKQEFDKVALHNAKHLAHIRTALTQT
jgi:hypothetical protein